MYKEIWRPVFNYEGHYEVSNKGNVRSLKRVIKDKSGARRVFKGMTLKLFKRKDGYMEVRLNKSGNPKTRLVHQLVAEAFLGHTPDGTNKKVVNHININRSDNRLENIEVITNRKNTNQAHLKSSSRFVGVSKTEYSTYRASIQINGNSVKLGSFKNEKKAAAAYSKALNNADKYKGDNEAFLKDLGIWQEPNATSKYEGVNWEKKKNKWKAQTRINGKQLYLGLYATEQEAHTACLKAQENSHKYTGDLKSFRLEIGLKDAKSSKHAGVSWCRVRNKWKAQGTKNYKNYLIGRHNTEEEAVEARLKWETEIKPTL